MRTMNDGPFLDSTNNGQTAKQNQGKKPFLIEHCQDYSLSAMAIVFGIGVVLAGLIIAIIGVTIHETLFPSPLIGYAGLISWIAFSVWLWVSLVIIGKTNRKSRVSDAELIALQALFFISIFTQWVFASPQDKAVSHQLSLVFEWCVIVFHILYFLLALCVWVRLPLRSYVAFIIMLMLAVLQTIYW